MNIEYVGRSYDISDADRDYIESKLRKVLKFLDEPIEFHVALEIEKHRHIAEIHVTHRNGSIQAAESTGQMTDAIHMVVDKIEKQARRAKKKLVDRRRRSKRPVPTDGSGQWPLDVVEGDSLRGGEGPRIIKSSLLQIKPMSIEEAALQLDTSKNEFLVFRDSDTDHVSVLYKRRDSNYGLIAPEL